MSAISSALAANMGLGYFWFNDNVRVYIQTEGLAMGAPTSAALSEIYLQYFEHMVILDALLQHKITG
jgi:hypothetical protein